VCIQTHIIYYTHYTHAYITNRFSIRGGDKLRRNTHAAASSALAAVQETLSGKIESLAPRTSNHIRATRHMALEDITQKATPISLCVCDVRKYIYSAYNSLVKTATSSSSLFILFFPLLFFFFSDTLKETVAVVVYFFNFVW